MPRKEFTAPTTPVSTAPGIVLATTLIGACVAADPEPQGWMRVFERGEICYWRRPGKAFGISATTNVHGSDLLWCFSSSTAFEPETSYSKFGAYALLEHGGDFARRRWRSQARIWRAGRAGTCMRGRWHRPGRAVEPTSRRSRCSAHGCTSMIPRPCMSSRPRWSPTAPPGDPVWVLLVCAPSTGKTEVLSAATRLPWVISAAKVTGGEPSVRHVEARTHDRCDGWTASTGRGVWRSALQRLHVRLGPEPGRPRRGDGGVAGSL